MIYFYENKIVGIYSLLVHVGVDNIWIHIDFAVFFSVTNPSNYWVSLNHPY